MEKGNKVSIWMGSFDSKESFMLFMEEQYDEEGDMSSKFMNAFEIDIIDNQFQESLFFEDSLTREQLKQFSYAHSFLDNLEEIDLATFNCVVFIYDIEYNEAIKIVENMKFIGSFAYSKD